MDTREISAYNTWYDFKKELHRRSGLLLLNKLWLQVKPRDPLPWHEFHMRQSLSLLSNRILRMRNCPRCGGNLVTDRDVDGYYKRCIQCSFSAEIIPAAPHRLPSAYSSSGSSSLTSSISAMPSPISSSSCSIRRAARG
jgi:hypothetical protein